MAQLNKPPFGYKVVLQSHSELTARMNHPLLEPVTQQYEEMTFRSWPNPLNSTHLAFREHHPACAEFISDFKLQHINSSSDDFIVKPELF